MHQFHAQLQEADDEKLLQDKVWIMAAKIKVIQEKEILQDNKNSRQRIMEFFLEVGLKRLQTLALAQSL